MVEGAVAGQPRRVLRAAQPLAHGTRIPASALFFDSDILLRAWLAQPGNSKYRSSVLQLLVPKNGQFSEIPFGELGDSVVLAFMSMSPLVSGESLRGGAGHVFLKEAFLRFVCRNPEDWAGGFC